MRNDSGVPTKSGRYKIVLVIMLLTPILLGLFICVICGSSLWLIRPNPPLANKEDTAKEKIPKGLKTKIQSTYGFVEDSGEFKKVLKGKKIYRYDDRGNQIEDAGSGTDGKIISKDIYKYDDKDNKIEWARYIVEELR